MPTFQVGTTAVRRDVFHDKVWSAHAFRVIEDAAGALVLGCGPGAELLAATTWIEWLLTGDDTARSRALPNLAQGTWQLDRWLWRETTHLQCVQPDAWFSVNAFYDVSDGHRLSHWYVNFQRPMLRTGIGFDTFDLFLDMVVSPDLSRWDWKDEGEYARGRRLGVVSEADHQAVEKAREEALAMIEEGAGPFSPDAGWRNWHFQNDWPAPSLPVDALAVALS